MSELMPLDPDVCPCCGGQLTVQTVDQPALVRHGGYGATERRVERWCAPCGVGFVAERSEVRP